LAFRKFEETVGATIFIQNLCRVYLARLDSRNASALQFVHGAANLISKNHTASTILIQRVVRGYQARQATCHYFCARRMQSFWRMSVVRRAYVSYMAARRIQTSWRCNSLRTPYVQYMAARRLQCFWRGILAFRKFVDQASARLIQSNWRRFSIRRAYTGFISARKIQTEWRRYKAHKEYTTFCASRRIQTAWSCCSLRSAYVGFFAARKIQATFRKYHAWRLYTDFRAAQKIQSLWRMRRTRDYYIMTMGSTRIQSAWRMKATRMYFVLLRNEMMKDEITAAIQVQKIWRGAIVRGRGYRFVEWIFTRDIRILAATIIQSHTRGLFPRIRYLEYKSATTIQKTWRCFTGRERYWHTLGSVIQIQAIIRRWQQQILCRKQKVLVHVIQRAVRCFFAREELSRRRFILKLISQVNHKSSTSHERERARTPSKQFEESSARTTTTARTKPSSERTTTALTKPFNERTTAVDDSKRIDQAARTIQKFFRMVKAEVDRAIRAKKKKRRSKHKERRKKKAIDEEDDNILENVWNTTLQNKSSRKGLRTSSSKHVSSRSKDRISSRSRKSKSRKDDTVILTSRRQWTKDDDNVSMAS
jgi:hypothetical protein